MNVQTKRENRLGESPRSQTRINFGTRGPMRVLSLLRTGAGVPSLLRQVISFKRAGAFTPLARTRKRGEEVHTSVLQLP